MADHRLDPATDELEARLVELGAAIAFPAAPDLSRRVAARLSAAPAPGAGAIWRRWLPRPRPARRAALLAVALLLLLVAIAAAVGILLPGLRLVFLPAGSTLPPVATISPTPSDPDGAALGARLGLGTAVDLEDVAGIAGFEPSWPPSLGSPDQAYVLNRRVTLLWAPDGDLPEIDATDVGLLLTQFEGRVDRGWYEKVVIEGATDVEQVAVDGRTGYWLTGDPHPFFYRDPTGAAVDETRRMVGDVLVWTTDDRTLRLESPLGRDETIALAESMPPDD